MNILSKVFGNAVHGAAIAVGFEKEPEDMGLEVIGSGRTFEEPGAEATAPPSIEFIPLNRHERRKLGIPKGQLGALVAAHSVDLSGLHERIAEVRSQDLHRSNSMGNGPF